MVYTLGKPSRPGPSCLECASLMKKGKVVNSRALICSSLMRSSMSPHLIKRSHFTTRWIRFLSFHQSCCFTGEVEPNSGGETPLVLSHVVYERMKEKHPEFVQRLEEHGLVYVRVLGEDDDPSSPIGRGWKSTFLTHDKNVAEERAAKLGMKLEWTEEGGAKTVMGPIPAIKFDESRNRKVWFNSMVAAYTWWEDKRNDPRKTVTFGDGEPLPEDIVHDCLRILEEECVAVPWQRGDVLLIDNWAVLHSRRPFESISEQATTSFYTIPLTLLFCI
ncbi:unnamed protein product [Brassica napus]|uniref:(rape) hypothetical protein n=1 Tax=Brassica napus TaxID=3708 RepID=A0A816J821_BRANA|nr:unnamed protein product [Brassica napus]